jgi:hypothetical protein
MSDSTDPIDAELSTGAEPAEAQRRAVERFGSPRRVAPAANREISGVTAVQLLGAAVGAVTRMGAIGLAAIALAAVVARGLAAITSTSRFVPEADGGPRVALWGGSGTRPRRGVKGSIRLRSCRYQPSQSTMHTLRRLALGTFWSTASRRSRRDCVRPCGGGSRGWVPCTCRTRWPRCRPARTPNGHFASFDTRSRKCQAPRC